MKNERTPSFEESQHFRGGKDYAIIKEISRGPISTVFLGKQLALERQVLIKLLNTQWQQEADLIERFRREALICARLKHPNIVSIFDVGTEADNLYLVIEYIEGQDVGQFLKKHHPIPFELILYIAREIVKGLAYAHSRGIIHRDIKPGNVMVSREGAVKITDFGLARSADLPALTAQGGTVGTPAYMSPEQTRGAELDQRSDLFSLGATFYEMAAGVSPFRGDNFAESIRKVLDETPAPLKQIRSDIPEWFSVLAGEMLSKEPPKRPASAREILEHSGFRSILASSEHLAAFMENPSGYAPLATETKIPPAKSSLKKGRVISAFFAGILALLILLIFIPEEKKEKSALSQTISDSTQELITPAAVDSLPADTSVEKTLIAQNIPGQPPAKSLPENSGNAEKPSPVPKEGDASENASTLLAATSPAEIQPAAGDTNVMAEKAAAPGMLYIACSPWAEVFIDGQKKETTPLSRPIALAAGEYLLELRNPNFQIFRQRIIVQPGKTDSMTVNLQALSGSLMLRVIPWAEIYINGRYVEKTPLERPITLPAGKYEVKLINPNFQTWSDSISIGAGEEILRQVSLSR